MAYTPEPTHPFDEATLPPQLNREFWALYNNDLAFKDFVTGALPIKAFYVILDGVGGADGGAANATLPTLQAGSYNIDRAINGGAGLIRTGEGVYVFTLRLGQIGGVDILPIMFPVFSFLIGSLAHLDATAESVRIILSDFDVPSATLELSVQQLEVPPSGKGIWAPYDMRFSGTGGSDRLFAHANFSLSGNAMDYPDTP